LSNIVIKADSADLLYPISTVAPTSIPSIASAPTHQTNGIEPLTPSKPAEEIVIERNNTPIFFSELEYKRIFNTAEAADYIVELESALNILSEAISSEEYSSIAVAAMMDEYDRIQDTCIRVQADIDKYLIWENEHYYATKTFLFLKQQGYNDAVVCGIIGNMMIETSGGSLNLNPTIYHPSGNYYGLCQWSLKYYPQSNDMSFEEQLELLLDTISYEFSAFGKLYKKGFTYEDFLAVTDSSEAAYIFAKVYERCNSISFDLRRQAAEDAYKYFILGN
jgi:hypothetical protein